MLSRRNVRIKVMQLLYAAGRDEAINLNDLSVHYQNYRIKIMELYLFNLGTFVDVAHYSVHDEVMRRAKLLPTDEDRRFEARLFNNTVLKALQSIKDYQQAISEHKIAGRLDIDFSRLMYNDFASTATYKKYLSLETPTQAEHHAVLLELYRFLTQNETFNERMEIFIEWLDDKTLVTGATKKLLKALPTLLDFYENQWSYLDAQYNKPYFNTLVMKKKNEWKIDYETYPQLKDIRFEFNTEDVAAYKFGEQLLNMTYKNESQLVEIIKPLLQNWDIERVTAIDMVLLKMALAELLYFPTIPTKVTINEYVDISKIYSTDKSKEFVNGVLDRLTRKLKEDGSIVKEGRGLVE